MNESKSKTKRRDGIEFVVEYKDEVAVLQLLCPPSTSQPRWSGTNKSHILWNINFEFAHILAWFAI
jgi:hypothetical protein